MRTDHIHMVNIDENASRTHTNDKEKDDVDEDAQPSGRTGRPSPPQRHAGRLATAAPAAGGIALAAAATSVAAAVRSRRSAARLAVPDRRPGHHRIRRSSPPPCAASSSVRPRCHRRGTPCACGRRQAGRRVGRQVKWTPERRSRARIRGADRAQGWKKAGGCAGGRIHAARGGRGARS